MNISIILSTLRILTALFHGSSKKLTAHLWLSNLFSGRLHWSEASRVHGLLAGCFAGLTLHHDSPPLYNTADATPYVPLHPKTHPKIHAETGCRYAAADLLSDSFHKADCSIRIHTTVLW
jgi:hypothetical protein